MNLDLLVLKHMKLQNRKIALLFEKKSVAIGLIGAIMKNALLKVESDANESMHQKLYSCGRQLTLETLRISDSGSGRVSNLLNYGGPPFSRVR